MWWILLSRHADMGTKSFQFSSFVDLGAMVTLLVIRNGVNEAMYWMYRFCWDDRGIC
jgi:hypothetical protein